jgi:hypothetical protein
MNKQLYFETKCLVEDIATLYIDYQYTLDKTQLIELSKVAVMQEILAELKGIRTSLNNIYNEI